MSTKKSSTKKATKQEPPATGLQPVKIEQVSIEKQPTIATNKSATAKLVNKATGRVVTMSRKAAENLSAKYPQQFETLS
jgi:hypothetical protein